MTREAAQPPLTIKSLSAAERRGFVLACQTMDLWGAQLERNARGLDGAADPIPRGQMLAHNARICRGLAQALERSATG